MKHITEQSVSVLQHFLSASLCLLWLHRLCAKSCFVCEIFMYHSGMLQWWTSACLLFSSPLVIFLSALSHLYILFPVVHHCSLTEPLLCPLFPFHCFYVSLLHHGRATLLCASLVIPKAIHFSRLFQNRLLHFTQTWGNIRKQTQHRQIYIILLSVLFVLLHE